MPYRDAMAPPASRARRSRMRPAPAILLAALTTATLLPFGQQPAAASCAGPYLTDADHLVLHHGTSAEIDGAAFADGCQARLVFRHARL